MLISGRTRPARPWLNLHKGNHATKLMHHIVDLLAQRPILSAQEIADTLHRVHSFAPDGERIGQVRLRETTASQSLYASSTRCIFVVWNVKPQKRCKYVLKYSILMGYFHVAKCCVDNARYDCNILGLKLTRMALFG